MKITTSQCFTLLAMGCACFTEAHADTGLTMQADIPEVSIEAGSPRRDFLRLPALSYAFTLTANCSEGLEPVSLQLSVADTRKTLRSKEITVNSATLVSLNVPASQIAPVVIKEFCARLDSQENESLRESRQSRIIIPAALSAQASLRCASESDEQTVYVSRPLDVAIACEAAAEKTPQR